MLFDHQRFHDCRAQGRGHREAHRRTATRSNVAAKRKRLAGEAFTGGKVTLSIGLAEFPEHGDTPETLIAMADGALYQAKDEGRDRVVRAGTLRRTREAKGG